MNRFNEFKKYMDKLGAEYSPRESGKTANFKLNYVNFQVTTHAEQDESLIGVSVALRKNGYYFPLGDTWNYDAIGVIENIEKILLEHDINISLVLRACW